MSKGIKLSFEGQTGVSQDERGCVDGERSMKSKNSTRKELNMKESRREAQLEHGVRCQKWDEPGE